MPGECRKYLHSPTKIGVYMAARKNPNSYSDLDIRCVREMILYTYLSQIHKPSVQHERYTLQEWSMYAARYAVHVAREQCGHTLIKSLASEILTDTGKRIFPYLCTELERIA